MKRFLSCKQDISGISTNSDLEVEQQTVNLSALTVRFNSDPNICMTPDSAISFQNIRRPLHPSAFLSVWRFQLPSGRAQSGPGMKRLSFLPKLRWWGCVSTWRFDLEPSLHLCFCEQDLSTSADVQTVKKDSSNEVEKIICEEKDNDHQVVTISSVKTTTCILFLVLL